jgi:hypothetical protein
MARSFGLVDYKVQEADFFLMQLRAQSKSCNFGAIQFTTSAFVSAARSITFAMQGSLKGNAPFDNWYAQKQAEMRGDALAKFFHDFRTVTQHLGVNVVGAGTLRNGVSKAYFVACPDLQMVPELDVLDACETYFRSVLSLVFECYEVMGPTIHGQWYFTEKHFASRGLHVEDAEEELGLPRGWTDIRRPDLVAYRWELLRRQADGCLIEDTFLRWLGKALPKPSRLPPMPE